VVRRLAVMKTSGSMIAPPRTRLQAIRSPHRVCTWAKCNSGGAANARAVAAGGEFRRAGASAAHPSGGRAARSPAAGTGTG
jgi:hypothetical protein